MQIQYTLQNDMHRSMNVCFKLLEQPNNADTHSHYNIKCLRFSRIDKNVDKNLFPCAYVLFWCLRWGYRLHFPAVLQKYANLWYRIAGLLCGNWSQCIKMDEIECCCTRRPSDSSDCSRIKIGHEECWEKVWWKVMFHYKR